MKISKNIIALCVLLSAQGTVLLGIAPRIKGQAQGPSLGKNQVTTADANFLRSFVANPNPSAADIEEFKQVEYRVNQSGSGFNNAALNQLYVTASNKAKAWKPGSSEQTAMSGDNEEVLKPSGPNILNPTVSMMLKYLEKPASERTAQDFERAKMAQQAFNKYFSVTLDSDAARFPNSGKIIEARNLFRQAVTAMAESNWNMITNRPIMKSKYENQVVSTGTAYLSFGDFSQDISNILKMGLSSKIKNESSLNEYIQELVDRMPRLTGLKKQFQVALPGRPVLEAPLFLTEDLKAELVPAKSDDLQLEDIAGMYTPTIFPGASKEQPNRDELMNQISAAQNNNKKMSEIDWQGMKPSIFPGASKEQPNRDELMNQISAAQNNNKKMSEIDWQGMKPSLQGGSKQQIDPVSGKPFVQGAEAMPVSNPIWSPSQQPFFSGQLKDINFDQGNQGKSMQANESGEGLLGMEVDSVTQAAMDKLNNWLGDDNLKNVLDIYKTVDATTLKNEFLQYFVTDILRQLSQISNQQLRNLFKRNANIFFEELEDGLTNESAKEEVRKANHTVQQSNQ